MLCDLGQLLSCWLALFVPPIGLGPEPRATPDRRGKAESRSGAAAAEADPRSRSWTPRPRTRFVRSCRR